MIFLRNISTNARQILGPPLKFSFSGGTTPFFNRFFWKRCQNAQKNMLLIIRPVGIAFETSPIYSPPLLIGGQFLILRGPKPCKLCFTVNFVLNPPKIVIAPTRKRNELSRSNFQDFLISWPSTTTLNKKNIHDMPRCTSQVLTRNNKNVICNSRSHVVRWAPKKRWCCYVHFFAWVF